jgi:opacity protein-like surface antigen
MKKLLIVLIALAMLAPMVIADDAKVMPAGVIRTYIVPSYVFGDQAFDADGKKIDGDEQSYFNLGAAIEFGINDFAAVQWAPGYNVTGENTKLDAYSLPGEASFTGPFEIFAGAKFQVVGPAAPVANDKFRFAVAPGVLIPAAFGYDAEEEATNATSGEDFRVLPAQNAFGLGARVYADYVINEKIFLNLYSQFKYFFPVKGENDFGEQFAYIASGGLDPIADEIDYGYELTLEFEPHFDTLIADGVSLGVGLPVTMVMTPESEIDGTAQDDASKKLTLNPGVSLFLMKTPVPLEFSFNYGLPVWGESASALQTVVFKVKTYMKF